MKKILCIDDEPMILNVLKRTLSTLGQIITAGSASEGLRLIAEQHVDLVISDCRMPKISGPELMETLRTLYPTTVRVLLTGYADLEATMKAINDGQVYRFIKKPCAPDELREEVRRCLAHGERWAEAEKLQTDASKKRALALDGLEHAFTGISAAPQRLGGAIVLDPKLLTVNMADFGEELFRLF